MDSPVSQPRFLSQGIPTQCGRVALASFTTLWWMDTPNLSDAYSRHPIIVFAAGCIPPEIGNLECLQLLNLASNCLSGEFRVVARELHAADLAYQLVLVLELVVTNGYMWRYVGFVRKTWITCRRVLKEIVLCVCAQVRSLRLLASCATWPSFIS